MTKAELKLAKKKYRLKRAIIRFLIWSICFAWFISWGIFETRTKEQFFVKDTKVCTEVEWVSTYHSGTYILHFGDGSKAWINEYIIDFDIYSLVPNRITVTIDTDKSNYRPLYNVNEVVEISMNGNELYAVQTVKHYRKNQRIIWIIIASFMYTPALIITFWELQEFIQYKKKAKPTNKFVHRKEKN